MTARAFHIASTIVGTLFAACASLAIAAEKGVTVRAPSASAEASVVATDMRIGGDDKQTRFVVDLNRKIDLVAFTLADPYRVVIDLPQTTFTLPAKAGEQARGLVKAFRYGLIMQGGSRIVLDTKGPVRLEKAFVLDCSGSAAGTTGARSHCHGPHQLHAEHRAGKSSLAQHLHQAERSTSKS